MQETLRLTLSPSRQSELRSRLEKAGYRFFDNDHAFWRAKSDTHTVVFYKSGALLLQGDGLVNRRLAETLGSPITPPPGESAPAAVTQLQEGLTVLGMDESGKGDLFGPLVLAAAVGKAGMLTSLGAADCKKLTDARVAEVFRFMENAIPWKVRVIVPAEYNALYSRHGNLNRLLAAEYASLLSGMQEIPHDLAVLDRFSPSAEQNAPIVRASSRPLRIVPGGEAEPAVAAASVVARYHFVRWIAETSEKMGRVIPKGAGPLAAALFHEWKRSLPESEFLAVAKAHFNVKESY